MSLVVGTNSYVDVDDADTYFEDALHAADWDAAGATVQPQALVTATRMIDRQNWISTKTDADQDLEFPRVGLTDKDGAALADDEVPQPVIDATCELALALIIDAEIQGSSDAAPEFKRMKAGSVEVERFARAAYVSGASRFPTIVQELIGLWLEGSVRTGGAAYGTEEETQMGPEDGFPFTGGTL